MIMSNIKRKKLPGNNCLKMTEALLEQLNVLIVTNVSFVSILKTLLKLAIIKTAKNRCIPIGF